MASSPEGARAPPPPIMDDGTGSPPPRREALDPSNEGSAEPSRESPEAPTEHPRSRRRRRLPLSQRPTLEGPDPYFQSRDDGTGSPPPRREALDPSNGGPPESSRESPEAPLAPPGSMDDGAADPSPASRVTGLLFRDPITGLLFATESALLQHMRTRAEEHPGVVSRSEVSRLVTDSPTLEALSLIGPPLLTPQTTETDAEESDDEVPPECGRSGFGFRFLGPQTLRYPRPPRPKWTGGVRGQGMVEKHAGDANSSELDQSITDLSRSEALSVTASSSSRSEKPAEDSDDDTEEELRLLEEYFDAHPPTSISQAFDELEVANHAALTSLAAEWGIEPPPPLSPPRRQFLADQEQQKASAAVAHPQYNTIPRKLRQDASDEEIVENAKKWMRDEVTLVFQNYIGRRDDLKIVDYHLDELCHQCVSVEDYYNIFHHYNFKVKFKKVNSDDWVGALYFAEVKQMFGRKSYFCCQLEPNENGHCHACQNQGVDDLRHPATGGYTDVGYGLWYPDE